MLKTHSFLLNGLACCLISLSAFAGNPSEKITHIKYGNRLPNSTVQKKLRETESWKQFSSQHPHWNVVFDETTGKPHRAYGPGIQVSGSTALERAKNFISSNLSGYAINLNELVVAGGKRDVVSTDKHDQINLTQYYKGIPVAGSRITVKMDKSGKVIMFGLDFYATIDISITPTIGSPLALSNAGLGLSGVLSSTLVPGLKVLPIPGIKSVDYHLVYTVNVKTHHNGMPGDYLALVDANNGEILNRHNRVLSDHANKGEGQPAAAASVNLQGTVSYSSPLVPPAKRALVNVGVNVNGVTSYTDQNGNTDVNVNGATPVNIPLAGKWVEVRNQSNGGEVPYIDVTVNAGPNNVNFDNGASEVELSAYYNVNIIHDYQKAVLGGFPGMDFTLPANVDIEPAICNAYYDGSSINFFFELPDCVSLARISDVIFHEYGHGINRTYYDENGSYFQNGAMNEGYADVWAISLNEDPILAEGFLPLQPDASIRRYDIDPKVYPNDIQNESHADGEIIAGAWWDTYLNLAENMSKTMYLFSQAYPGFQAEAFDGEEGKAFTDVLLDVLQADDDDADLSNGTPNGAAIAAAFRRHGITLLTSAEINHTEAVSSPENQPIKITAKLELENQFDKFVDGVYVYYATNTSTNWTSLNMFSADKINFSANLPAMPKGTIVKYFFSARDNFGGNSAVQPFLSDQVDGNIPYITLVGFNLIGVDDADGNYKKFGNWGLGTSSGDDAYSGAWERCASVATYDYYNREATPGTQTTPGGTNCFATENAQSEFDDLTFYDVDGGKTTLQSPVINMSTYKNPTISYNRWFTNDLIYEGYGNEDYWQVSISNNGGTSWKFIENTKVSDMSWRRFAFRVKDYIVPTDKMRIRFVASDSLRTDDPFYQGASTVEAAMDDFTLYDADVYNGLDESTLDLATIQLFPNPSAGELNILLPDVVNGEVMFTVKSITGAVVYTEKQLASAVAGTTTKLMLPQLEDGIYLLEVGVGDQRQLKKFSLIH